MSDQDFIEQASISAMQGILSNPNRMFSIPSVVARIAVSNAEELLNNIKKNNYSKEENDVMSYIHEVDERQGMFNHKINERLDGAMFKIDTLIHIIEQHSPGWINIPIKK